MFVEDFVKSFSKVKNNSILCVRSNRDFDKFLGDPYYEPLSQFMIQKVEVIL